MFDGSTNEIFYNFGLISSFISLTYTCYFMTVPFQIVLSVFVSDLKVQQCCRYCANLLTKGFFSLQAVISNHILCF